MASDSQVQSMTLEIRDTEENLQLDVRLQAFRYRPCEGADDVEVDHVFSLWDRGAKGWVFRNMGYHQFLEWVLLGKGLQEYQESLAKPIAEITHELGEEAAERCLQEVRDCHPLGGSLFHTGETGP